MMGQARRRQLAMGGTGTLAEQVRALNGGGIPKLNETRVPIVSNIKLENVQDHTLMILGEKRPLLATALTPDKARELAAALLVHADQIEASKPRIILPGDLQA